ncbi:MAG: LytTR family transcriptional regulator [Lactobacillus sp.]|uniref:LytTR family DNA-binding domain-containing protein n=1 Tax=Lactobacillus sp. TaxID=1591 RepID=UPI0023C07518|nr:LytTR family DNA-binding domain-containing protein [Lactobacillus sp.]MDE7050820.1 LytTR family transcriptional regulator [Lactobacillus sp.]
MKIKFHIDEHLPEEKAEFWLRKMTERIRQITEDLTREKDFVWCYQGGNVFSINFSDIYLIQVENEKTYVYTETENYLYKGRLYQIQQLLPSDFVMASRSALVNYHKLDHLQILNDGNVDAILKNNLTVQISRRKIKDLKEVLGL